MGQCIISASKHAINIITVGDGSRSISSDEIKELSYVVHNRKVNVIDLPKFMADVMVEHYEPINDEEHVIVINDQMSEWTKKDIQHEQDRMDGYAKRTVLTEPLNVFISNNRTIRRINKSLIPFL